MPDDNQVFTTFPVHKVELKSNLEAGTPVQVFRNSTTAVEVIVKEVPNKRKKEQSYYQAKTSSLEEKHNNDLDISHETVEVMRKGFNIIIYEMKKQLDELNQKNLDIQMKNLSLQLENHKFKIMLECKTHLIGKLKKEFQNMKHSLKYVIKSLGCVSKIPDNVTFISDTEYEDFENGLKKEAKFALFDGTLGSGRSKERISEKN